MRYHDMSIEASDLTAVRLSDGRRLVQFRVRALESPAGEMRPEQAPQVEYVEGELAEQVRALAARALDRAGLVALGRALADLLLPADVRELFAASMAQLAAEEGLRLRLRLPPELATLPWEYVYAARDVGEETSDVGGFLALDPRVAIVRHEPLPVAVPPPPRGGALRLVAALASPAGLPELDLAQERAAIERAIAGQAGIEPVFLDDATLDALQGALLGAEIFHFAGHGLYQGGAGALALDDGRLEAEQLALMLRGGARLAVLGGCETGRRDAQSPWAGVALALVRAEVPAVVANQLTITNDAAVAFCRHFYGALVGGLPLERALAAGRIAAYNADPQGREWGVAVLYLRGDGALFAGSADEGVRRQAATAAQALFNVHVERVGADARVTGATVGRISKGGALGVDVEVGVSEGAVEGLRSGPITSGSAEVDVDVKDAQSGTVSGGTIEEI